MSFETPGRLDLVFEIGGALSNNMDCETASVGHYVNTTAPEKIDH